MYFLFWFFGRFLEGLFLVILFVSRWRGCYIGKFVYDFVRENR